MAPAISGFAVRDGFVRDALIAYYARRAQGGVGLIITEPLRVAPPNHDDTRAYLGLYADAFVPQLRTLTRALHEHGASCIITLSEPAEAAQGTSQALLVERFVLAAWRALAAECDGVMLSLADRGALHTMVSPLLTWRAAEYRDTLAERLHVPLQIIEQIRAWFGARLIIGARVVAEEFHPGGMRLHDARMIAKRLVAAGTNLLDVTVDIHPATQIARFPGWTVPLVERIKRIVPNVPVIAAGLLDDPHLADSVIREGSADMIMLGRALRINPDWPQTAYAVLQSGGSASETTEGA